MVTRDDSASSRVVGDLRMMDIALLSSEEVQAGTQKNGGEGGMDANRGGNDFCQKAVARMEEQERKCGKGEQGMWRNNTHCSIVF